MKINKLLLTSALSIVTCTMINAEDSIQKLDSVIVTANKIEENVQYVPQSITVIDSVQIEEKGIRTIEDVIREIPNMSTIPDRGVQVNFRGLNASKFTANNPVVVYLDGIPSSFKRAFTASLENVERIEVLRGPQGTLYGKNAIGGVINIITKEPNNDTSGNIGFEYGSDNYIRRSFNLNTALIEDKLFLNLNGELTSTDGWVTNTYNNDDEAGKEEDENFGTSLYYKITDKLSTRLVLKRGKSKKNGFKGYGITTTYDALYNPSYADLGDFKRANAENTSFEKVSLEENTIDSQSFDIKYETDNYRIDAVTVHRKADLDGTYDADQTIGTVFDNSVLFNDASTDNFSQEIRVSNKEANGVRWIAGVYIDKEEKTKDAYGFHTIYNGVDYGTTNTLSTVDSDTQAIFAQSRIPLNDKLDLTLGSRYQKIEKEVNVDQYNNGIISVEYDDKKSSSIFLPKIALSYKMNDNFTPFASISKGYMPGGFNILASTSDSEQNTFDDQTSINYELGIKASLDDLIFTASIFRMDIKDIHVFRQPSATTYYTDNADKAHSQGIEFDFTYLPTDTLEVSGAVGVIKTKYDSYKAGIYDFSGKEIENTPAHTINLSVAYYHPNGFYVRTDIKNQGSMYFYDDLQKDFSKESSYTLVGAKIGYKFSDWDTYIYGKNLTDEEYINTYEANDQFATASFGEPRFIGIGVKYTF